MNFLCDHCVWKPTIRTLRDAGLALATLQELGRAEARNGEVLALARDRQAVLITRDRDFVDLASSRSPHAGIIFLNITPDTMDAVHATLRQALGAVPLDRLRNALLIVGPATYRLHRPT